MIQPLDSEAQVATSARTEYIMNLVGIGSYTQPVVKGAIIALAVAYDILSKTKRSRRILGDIGSSDAPAKITPAA